MTQKGENTRERILETAEALLLEKGFSGTSLDDVLKIAGLTKGAFFHHFKGKAELARALLERYWDNDYKLFVGFSARAQQLADDPLQETLIFLKLFEEFINDLDKPLPGCVFASYTYESRQFDPEIHEFIRDGFDKWSELYEGKFEAVLARYTPALEVSARELSEMIMSIVEGGFILSLSYRDPIFIARQSKQFRHYLQLLFRP